MPGMRLEDALSADAVKSMENEYEWLQQLVEAPK
jgi:hypothetical protein